VTPELTPSQTIGPFYHFSLPFQGGEHLVEPDDPDAVRIVGTVYDGAGEPISDAMLEVWQANRAGRYAHPEDDRDDPPLEEGFTGFGRCPTDSDGRYEFVTLKPGAVPGPDGRPQAPHIDVSIFARGLLRQLVTRIYFPDEKEANASDPVLSSIEDPEFRQTLIATDEGDALRFDVRLQGENQTAFFEF
jgi:protocatechuate 3,4-dioxygenase alpha subunit